MFIRKVTNRSGNTSVQVVHKVGRTNRLVAHIGTARTPLELDHLLHKAGQFVDDKRMKSGIISLFDSRFTQSELEDWLNRVNFPQAIDTTTFQFFHHFYKVMGFGVIDDDCFADLVVARIVEPGSKVKTRDLLEAKFGKTYSLAKIYRTLARTYQHNYQQVIERIIIDFVRRKITSTITVLFFDVTTLYYEAFDQDDFRKFGFSKDHKENQPQIVVALTVTKFGIPLHLRIFEGNKFEGHTIIPCITELAKRHKLKDFVVVADSAMLSEENMKRLEENHLKFIVGARLGNLNEQLLNRICSQIPKVNGQSHRFTLKTGKILIVSYSTKRAAKDRSDRQKQLKRANYMLVHPAIITNRFKFITKAGTGGWKLNLKIIDKTRQLEGLKG